ncbi:MAG TPA: hypothetical protein ENK91_08765 [Bacteroidetes bacterium]|nr:hypothetical protein [Bacteroidota bacterium]
MQITKQTFKEDFPYLFQKENYDYEIKLSEYELMELFETDNKVMKYDIEKSDSLNISNNNAKALLVNFFSDTLNHEVLEKLQDKFDLLCDNCSSESLCMWCTTSQSHNTNNLYAEIFLAL